jgi:hypothetical protein
VTKRVAGRKHGGGSLYKYIGMRGIVKHNVKIGKRLTIFYIMTD